MIRYRKTAPLRMTRAAAPQTPFWQRTTLAPYGGHRDPRVSIDYASLSATSEPRSEVEVCNDPEDQMQRAGVRLEPPLLIDATGSAERVYRRGEETLRAAQTAQLPSVHLLDAASALPRVPCSAATTLVIAAWPPEMNDLDLLFGAAGRSPCRWGALLPLLFPITTRLEWIEAIADSVARHAGSFLAAVALDLAPPAKHVLARWNGAEDESFATLFHEDLELIEVASERHVAALAAERGLRDWIEPPETARHSNWSAAAYLAHYGTRMVRMKHQVELGWTLLRSAAAVASLDKQLTTVAASATLGIIEAIDEVSTEALARWLQSGTFELFAEVDRHWRLRRDHGV
ncbi:MAG TPA: hypothetical protein VM534_10415 [Thermoanaerobaculia bacterium]|nr:hypothetical protein [Thermoanaerobaculia bacterium]